MLPGWAIRGKLLTAVLLVIAVMGTVPTPARATSGTHSALHTQSVPAPAQTLARLLHVTAHPFVGDDVNGTGRGWTAWFPRTVRPAWVGPGNVPTRFLPLNGPALFVGPRGAKGEFHYFNGGSVGNGLAPDTYRGAALTRSRGLGIAYTWLRKLGRPIPRGSPHVDVRPGMTVIGGTGLCCYRSLAVLSWKAKRDAVGNVQSAADMIYVADAGTVVEADIGPLVSRDAYGFSHPCAGRTRVDANGIAVGTWCFDYAEAVRTMIIGDIGNHSTWVDDPRQLADIGAASVLRRRPDPKHTGPRRQVVLTTQRAVFRQSYQGTPYRLTYLPAFPGLAGSIWELARVQRVR